MQKKNFYKISILFVIFLFQQNSLASTFEGIPRVIDGDSLEINNNKIRLFGIDAPEKKQTCKKPYLIISFINFQRNYKCGLMATNQLNKFIDNRAVKCISENKD